MTSKEALQIIWNCYDAEAYETYYDGAKNVHEEELKIIEKDLDQLEEYRKIEKEIGIEFITLIKILKNDVYINDGGIVDEIGNIYTAQVKSIERWPVWGFTAGDNVEYAFKDRGKTWALDKEEFYRNIK